MAEKVTNSHISDTLSQLTKTQLDFVVALQEYPTKKEAAEAIGIVPAVVYRWPKIVDEAARMLSLEALETAREMRKKAIAKAMKIKIEGLDSTDEKIRQSVATEIIESELGKASQSIDLTSKGEGINRSIKLEELSNDDLNRIADILRTSQAANADRG